MNLFAALRSIPVFPRAPLGWVMVVYGILGLLLWGLPLFNVLHAESSAVVAGAAFFAAGLSSLALFGRGAPVGRTLAAQLLALLVPWFLLTVTLLWVPNCGYGQGLLFYLLFAPGSVVLAVALAYALSATSWRFKRGFFVGAGLLLAVVPTLYDLGLHPQFFVYNHVFGGVVGPIYDEELTIRPGLPAFRGLTLLWALLAFGVGRRLSLRRAGQAVPTAIGRPGSLAGLVAVVLGIGGCYLAAVPLGINAAGWHIRSALGGWYQTAHFDIYYDPDALAEDEVRWLAEDHEFRYARLAARLNVDVAEPIASYLYPDPETKARLTGARATNVAPVWLRRPQVHVLQSAYAQVFAHELAHVFSREFGLPVLKASLSVGLVEGLAVALEPPDGLPTPHEQVAAAVMQQAAAGGNAAPSPADDLARRLTPVGFWTGRGAVSYTTMGSFVRYLLDAYGPALLKRVYARADFASVYGKPVDALAREWERYVLGRPVVDRAAGAFVSARFSIPSLFEKRCPHYVPVYRRLYRRGLEAWAEEDTSRALALFEDALRRQPAYEPAQVAWAYLKLAEAAPDEVLERFDTLALDGLSPALAVRLGDAYAVTNRPDEARARYAVALGRTPGFAHEQVALTVMRNSLADDPVIMHILTSGGPAEERARRLGAYDQGPPAARGYEALFLASAGNFEQAVGRLRTTPDLAGKETPAAHRNVLGWQRLSWLALWSYRAGDPEAAATYARGAARALNDAGAFNAADRMADFDAKMAWVGRHNHTTVSLDL